MLGQLPSYRQRPPRSAIVVGAGVVGVATAWSFARRGVAVTLIDISSGPGEGASFANGGQLSYVYTDALASPWLLRKLPGILLARDPGLSLNLGFDPGVVHWLLDFLRNATTSRHLVNTVNGLALGLESRLAMHDLLAQHHLDFSHRVAGKLLVYSDQDAFDTAARLAEIKQQHGAVQEILGPAEAIALEPVLGSRSEPMAGAIYAPQEELGDPYRFCRGMVDLLTSTYGVTARFQTRVRSWEDKAGSVTVLTNSGERLAADALVICAGIASGKVLNRAGLTRALLPMKGYSFTAPQGQMPLTRSITDMARKIVFCPLNGMVRVAGLAELGTYDTKIEPARIAHLKLLAAQSLVDAADYSSAGQEWAGIRPMTANSQPIIRRVTPGVAINAGHGMLGWTYAMGAAERVARLFGKECA